MADEHIYELYPVPEVLPDLLLRTPLDLDEIASDLNVAPVDDLDFWPLLFDERDQAGHLGVVDDHNIGASFGEWTTLAEPVALGVVYDPVGHMGLSLFIEPLGRVGDALQDVVVRFRDSKDLRIRLRNVPTYSFTSAIIPKLHGAEVFTNHCTLTPSKR